MKTTTRPNLPREFPDSLRPKKTKGALSRTNPDGAIYIMHLADNDYFYTLDKIAAEVWTCIDGNTTLAQIKTKILRDRGSPEKNFNRNVAKLLNDLVKADLISFDHSKKSTVKRS